MSYFSDFYRDGDAAREEIVLSALESIDTLTDDERENVRHELWLVIDAAELEVEPGEAFWADIDAAVDKGLSYTRTIAA